MININGLEVADKCFLVTKDKIYGLRGNKYVEFDRKPGVTFKVTPGLRDTIKLDLKKRLFGCRTCRQLKCICNPLTVAYHMELAANWWLDGPANLEHLAALMGISN
jgi:hypothetical protein